MHCQTIQSYHRGPCEVLNDGCGRAGWGFDRPGAGCRRALRKKPDGPLLPSAHAVEPEHRAIAALQGSAMPVDRRQVQAHFPRRER